jgi:hypothetical protein
METSENPIGTASACLAIYGGSNPVTNTVQVGRLDE